MARDEYGFPIGQGAPVTIAGSLRGEDEALASIKATYGTRPDDAHPGSAISAPTYGDPGREIRIVDPTTGGEKGQKLARTDLLPADALLLIAEHYGRGAAKYEARNWERGYLWSLSYAALLRHLLAWWDGEDIDPETGSSHAVAVAWHALALVTFEARHIGTDDRP